MSALQQDPIVIVGAARTPMGAFQGDFSALAGSPCDSYLDAEESENRL